MRRWFCFLLLFCGASLPACTALVDLENQVVAEVDDAKIRLRHVVDRIGRLSPQTRQAAASQAGREKILEDLINEIVLLAEAHTAGIAVTDADLDLRFAEERQSLSKAGPDTAAQGQMPVLRDREETRRLMTIERLTASYLTPVKVSERYESLRDNGPPRYAAQYEFVWVKIGDTTFPRQIQDAIEHGQNLETLSREHSRHPLFINGGRSHIADIEELEPWLRARLIDAKPGDVLEPYLTEQTGEQSVMFVKVLYKWNFPPIRAIQNEIVQSLYDEYLSSIKAQRTIIRHPERLALIDRQ